MEDALQPLAADVHAAAKSRSRSPPRTEPPSNTSESEMPQAASPPKTDEAAAVHQDASDMAAEGSSKPAPNAISDAGADGAGTEQQQQGNAADSGNAPAGARGQTGASASRMKHEDAMEFLERVRDIFSDRPFIYNSFLAVMKEFKDQTITTDGVINRVKLLFKGHPDLLMGFNLFLPPAYRIRVEAESPPNTASSKIEDQKAQQFASAYKYVTKVKKRFISAPHTYKEFLTVLHKYQMVHRSVDLVNTQITRLFRSHPDLLSEFAMFLPERKPKTDASGSGLPSSSRVHSSRKPSGGKEKALEPSGSPSYVYEDKGRRDLQLFERIKKRLGNPLSNSTQYNDFLKCVHLFTQDVLSRDDLVEVLQDLLGTHRELFADFKLFLGVRDDDTQAHLPMCVGDLDLSKAIQAGTSYKKLPDDFCPPPASNCSTLCQEVLNTRWVSVAMGSEDYSFKHFRKNQYEESLFKCEDDRYELDMVIECNASTLRTLQPLLERINKLPAHERSKFRMPKTLKTIHAHAIELVYADHGADVVDYIHRAPATALPVVIPRLQAKDEEWRGVRRDMNRIWKDVYERNYLKSLDHRSFYFKQIDKRNLSSKGLVSEMRALVEAGKPAVILYPCADVSLHKDVFDLIMMIADSDSRHYSEEGVARLMRFFRSFVLPSMGLTSEEISSIIPPESSSYVSDRTTYSFNDASAMPNKDLGLSPMEISLHPSEVAAIPLSEHELNAQPHRLLYCNSNLFVLFRLYGILYDRLKNARALESPSMRQCSYFFQEVEPPAPHCRKEEGAYPGLFRLMRDFFTGQIDNGKFEDECRLLLGTNSYELFTLDKVLDKFLSHAQSTFQSDDVALRLSVLNAYESTRASGFSPALLRCNAQSVCGQDELLFTAMYVDGGAGKGRQMRLELLPTPSCFTGGDDGVKERKRADISQAALLRPSSSCTASPPFLHRSLQSSARVPLFDTIGLEFKMGRGGAGFDFVPFTSDACVFETSGRVCHRRIPEELIIRAHNDPDWIAANSVQTGDEIESEEDGDGDMSDDSSSSLPDDADSSGSDSDGDKEDAESEEEEDDVQEIEEEEEEEQEGDDAVEDGQEDDEEEEEEEDAPPQRQLQQRGRAGRTQEQPPPPPSSGRATQRASAPPPEPAYSQKAYTQRVSLSAGKTASARRRGALLGLVEASEGAGRSDDGNASSSSDQEEQVAPQSRSTRRRASSPPAQPPPPVKALPPRASRESARAPPPPPEPPAPAKKVAEDAGAKRPRRR